MKRFFTSWLGFISILTIFAFSACNNSYDSTFDFASLRSECGDEVELFNDNPYIVVKPTDKVLSGSQPKGFIFYPGGLVSYQAYLPLMIKCAKNGIQCFIIQMPSDFAILNMNAADRILFRYPEIEEWYIGGHSLGGAMAASYVSSHHSSYEGLILMAAYSTEDLSETNLKILSLYGSLDGVLNMEKYQKYRSNLAVNDFTEVVIEGGNHAQFGTYGKQDGDNDSEITAEEQQSITASKIAVFCGLN